MMKRIVLFIALSYTLIGTDLRAAQPQLSPGQQLASEMRQTQLLNYDHIAGYLRKKARRGERSNRNLSLQTALVDGQWMSRFTTLNPETGESERLTIYRSPEQRPRYYRATAQPGSVLPDQGDELEPSEIMSEYAGSDFWVADLGLEFFYWPDQKILSDAPIRMRKGISCFVLESERKSGASTTGYTRVRSWISRDHGGLIYAEAYDASGKQIKTFEVSDVEKIDGEWKLRELSIRDEVARSVTRLILTNR